MQEGQLTINREITHNLLAVRSFDFEISDVTLECIEGRPRQLKLEKKYRCHFVGCERAFGTKGNLKAHIALHLGNKPFSCDHCSKAYISRCRLEVHMRTHVGVMPYECKMCARTFNEKGNLKIHLRVHTGERPYRCHFKECGKAFKTNGHLYDHLRIHSKERKYECTVCRKSFARSSTLKTHLNTKNHLNLKKVLFDSCGSITPTTNSESPVAQKVIIQENPTPNDQTPCVTSNVSGRHLNFYCLNNNYENNISVYSDLFSLQMNEMSKDDTEFNMIDDITWDL